MADLITKNLSYLRTLSTPDMPDLGARLYETLSAMNQQHQNLAMQTTGNSTGTPQTPPQVNGVSVTGSGGMLHVAVQDNNEIYRGINYYAVHADNPNFTNPQIVDMGSSRNVSIPVGNQSRYAYVYSAYGNTGPSAPVYHGGATPIAVHAGSFNDAPSFPDSQGSGTGPAGLGHSGPGNVPFRSATGVPPVRGGSNQ